MKSYQEDKEILEALEEAMRLIKDPNTKRYNDIREIWDEVINNKKDSGLPPKPNEED